MSKLAALAALIIVFVLPGLAAGGQRIVRPVEIDSLLDNPGIGFDADQYVDRRPGPDGQFRVYDRPLPLDQYPRASVAYLRFDWRYLEPERGKFNWYLIDGGLRLARESGQHLALRIVPYGNQPRADIPDWLREEIGTYDSLPHSFWRVKHSEPQYIRAITELASALGERYDGNPDIDFVDAGIVGFWGEGAGSELLPQEAREKLVDAYLNAFKKTQVVMLLTDERTNKYAMSRANVGWRVDCLGDLGFWANEQNGWTHMFDYYPESIINFGVADAWKTAPVVLEICGTFRTWKEREHYDSTQVAYNLAQALKWHVSVFNAKSSPVPPEWRGMVDQWLKHMGYRLAPRKFTYPDTLPPQGKLAFTSWWENKGVAPCYRNYPVALRLTGADHSCVLVTDSDIRQWLPGDALFDSAVFIPPDFPEGDYSLSIGIVDPQTREPVVRLAVAGRDSAGWYPLGGLTVKR